MIKLDREEIERQIANIEDEIESMKSDLEDIEAQMDGLREEENYLERELSDLERQLLQLQEELNEIEVLEDEENYSDDYVDPEWLQQEESLFDDFELIENK